jgi:hypothetical protein
MQFHTQCGTVNGGICTDLHITPDVYTAYLWDLPV